MKKINFLFLLLLFTTVSFSQSPAGIWYFGKKAGINFNSSSTPIVLNDGQIDTNEGCATLCDENGNLLFYTDGIKIWNKNHTVMPNGNGLLGDPSSTQSAIIVPNPGSPNLFYVFTVDELGKANGLNYSVIDLTLDGGLGNVTTKNVLLATPTLEKITVAKHDNGINFWVIAHKYNSNQFISYQITPTGINPAVISSAGVSISGDTQKTIGYMKSSPDGKYLAVANGGSGSVMQLFNFNQITGQITLLSTSPLNTNYIGGYGVEFSSNNKVLYVSNIDFDNFKSELYQFNIEVPNETAINNSKLLIASYDFDNFQEGIITALQLAPNQKIYIGRNNTPSLGVINSPNNVGVSCNVNLDAINLGLGVCYFGLPSFITSYLDQSFTSSNYCTGNPTQFNGPEIDFITSSTWNFGDAASASNTSTLPNPTHVFSSSGVFTVSLTITTATTTKTFTKNITIIDSPTANQPTNMVACDTDNSAVFDLSTKTNEVLGIQSPSDYVVTYFLNYNDAFNNVNPIAINYTNITNPQTIYTRIQPINGDSCFDVSNFNLVVNQNPNLLDDAEVFYCLNTFPAKISLNAGQTGPASNYTYLWSTGQTTPTLLINTAGIYTVKVTDAFGCSSTRTITVTSSEIATINYTITGTIGNYNLVVNPVGIGSYEYSIDNASGPYQTSATFYDVNPGDHQIFVKDTKECGIAFENFTILGYPNFFTPNNDGINDYWKLTGHFTDISRISIFDRYGKLIHQFSQNSVGWNGKYNGYEMPASDYWFIAKRNNGEEIRGHFSLIR